MTIRSCLFATLAVCASGALACGPSGGTSVGTGADACVDYATNYCNRLAACSPFLLSKEFGDAQSCMARLEPICRAAAQAPGTALGREQSAACASAYSTASCDDLLNVDWQPDACAVKGSLADGAACGQGAQCASGHCKMDFDQVCGTCATLIASGGQCSRSEDCEAGLGCISPGTCGALSPRGASCRTKPCALDLTCIGGTCDSPLGLGAACVPAEYACNLELGLYCDSDTMRCVQGTLVATGGSCSTFAMPCLASGSCGDTSVCEAPLADGAACASTSQCLFPAVCVSGSCRSPDPTTCH